MRNKGQTLTFHSWAVAMPGNRGHRAARESSGPAAPRSKFSPAHAASSDLRRQPCVSNTLGVRCSHLFSTPQVDSFPLFSPPPPPPLPSAAGIEPATLRLRDGPLAARLPRLPGAASSPSSPWAARTPRPGPGPLAWGAAEAGGRDRSCDLMAARRTPDRLAAAASRGRFQPELALGSQGPNGQARVLQPWGVAEAGSRH
jgi:hypothetical protein